MVSHSQNDFQQVFIQRYVKKKIYTLKVFFAKYLKESGLGKHTYRTSNSRYIPRNQAVNYVFIKLHK